MTLAVEQHTEEYSGEKWEYLQCHDEASVEVDTEELNKYGAQGWQLCMAYIISQPVAVLSSAVIDPSKPQVRLSRVYVYRRPLKEVKQ